MTNIAARTFSNDIERRKVLGSAEAAAFVGLSIVTFRRQYRKGKIPRGLQLSEKKLGWQIGTLCDWLDAKRAEAA